MLLKIPYERAEQLLCIYQQEDDDQESDARFDKSLSPEAYIQLLIDAKEMMMACDFFAHAMPVREAVWWAYCCAVRRDDWSNKDYQALNDVSVWVKKNDELSRRAAEKSAKATDLQTGAGWAAQAAFWSGGSICPPDVPFTAPPPYMYAKAVAASVKLTASLPDGKKTDKYYPLFMNIGFNIARGGAGDV